MSGLISTLPIYTIPLPTPWSGLKGINAYLVREDPVTLVDPGLSFPAGREALLAGLRSAGVALREIRRVLLTHAHPDHYGLAAWIQDAAGAEVWVHPEEAGKLSEPAWYLAARERILADAGVPAETARMMKRYWAEQRKLVLPLQDWLPAEHGRRFPFASGELTAVHLPGHSLGHVAFWSAADGLLLGGDLLLEGVTPNPLMEPLPEGHSAGAPHAPGRALVLEQFRNSMKRLAELPIEQVLPGHGPVIHDHKAVILGYQARYQRKLNATAQTLAGGKTAYQVTREIYPGLPDYDFFLGLSQVLAQLDLLAVTGRAAVEPGPQGSIFRAI